MTFSGHFVGLFQSIFPSSHNVVAPFNPTNPQPSAECGMTPRLINFRTGNPTGHYKLDLEPWFHIAELGVRPMAGQSMLAIFPPKLTFWECNFAPQRFMQAKKDRDWWRYVVPYFSLAKTTIGRYAILRTTGTRDIQRLSLIKNPSNCRI